MSTVMEEEFKRWTAKRKAALVTELKNPCYPSTEPNA